MINLSDNQIQSLANMYEWGVKQTNPGYDKKEVEKIKEDSINYLTKQRDTINNIEIKSNNKITNFHKIDGFSHKKSDFMYVKEIPQIKQNLLKISSSIVGMDVELYKNKDKFKKEVYINR